MESTEVKKRGRGRPRKRRREEEEKEENDKKLGSLMKRQAFDMRWKPLVGMYVMKEFEGSGVFLGKVVYYDRGLYRVDYEDGDCEDLDSRELRKIILWDNEFDDDLSLRKRKLDELVLEKSVNRQKESGKNEVELKSEVVDASVLSGVSCGLMNENNGAETDADGDSLSNSGEYDQDGDLGLEEVAPIVRSPQLPPSSGTINVPEECAAHIFSVYLFLRSFSIHLFLYPFSFDDFVGAINCQVQNTLVDSIHVALMRALRRHLETISSDGSELASKCLGCMDWSLLDSLTWPAYVVYYFTVMGYAEGPEWTGFYDDLLKREYYTVPVGRKIKILQLLCDDVLDSAELRAEIDVRIESEVGLDMDLSTTIFPENGPRRVHPRFSKTSACKDGEAMGIISGSHGTNPSHSLKYLAFRGTEGNADSFNADVDGNGDECRLCGMDGTLICCDGCPSAYHTRCIGLVKVQIPEGPWYCPECTIMKVGPSNTAGTSLRGAELFGIDLYEQVFLGTCNHLLVLSISRENRHRYYNENDIPKVLQVLLGSAEHRALYSEISKSIAQHWHIPQSCISPLQMMESDLNTSCVKERAEFCTLSLPSSKESHEGQDSIDQFSLKSSGVGQVASSHLVTSMSATSRTDSQGSINGGNTVKTQMSSNMNVMPPAFVKMESPGTCTAANSNCSHMDLSSGAHLTSIMSSQCKEGNCIGLKSIKGNSATNHLYMGTHFKAYSYINHYMHGEFAASAAANLALLSEESRGSEVHKAGNGRKVVSDIALQVKAFSAVASRFLWPSSERKLMEVPRERCGWCHSCKLSSNSRRGCYLNAAASSAAKSALRILSGLRPITHGEGSLRSISTYMLYLEEMLHGVTVGLFQSVNYRVQWRRSMEDASCYRTIKRLLLKLEENVRVIALSGEWFKTIDDWFVESSVIQSASSISVTTQKRGPGNKYNKKQFGISDIIAADAIERSFIWWQGRKLSNIVLHKAVLPRAIVKRAAQQGGSRKISGIFYGDDSEIPKRSRRLVWRAAVESSRNSAQLAFQVRYLDLHVRWSDLVRPEQNLQDVKGPETEASVFRNAIIRDKKIEENHVRYGVDFQDQKHLPSRVMKNIIEVEEIEDGKQKYWFLEANIPLYLIKEYEEKLDRVEVASSEKYLDPLSKLQRKQLIDSRKDIFSFLVHKRDKMDKCFCASCQQDVLLRNTVVCNACQGYCHKDCTVNSMPSTNQEVGFLLTCEKCCNANGLKRPEKISESPTTPLPLQVLGHHDAGIVTKTSRLNVYNQPVVSVRSQESRSETLIKKESSSETVIKKKESRSEMKQATSTMAGNKSKRTCNWGLIWKKKREDTGIDASIHFRSKNVLLKGSAVGSWLKPVCRYCGKEYNQELMYIHCELCSSWFHAEAVELEESKLPELLGFKCCRCRRIRPPTCPYSDDTDKEKPVIQRIRNRAGKQGNMGVASDVVAISESVKLEFKEPEHLYEYSPGGYMAESLTSKNAMPQRNDGQSFASRFVAESKVCEPTTVFPTEGVFVQDDDPLFFSLSRVENISENNLVVEHESSMAALGPQKLPVRRHAKHQGDDGVSEDNLYHAKLYAPVETRTLVNPEELSSCVQWDASGNGLQDEMQLDYEGLNYEDMEFEPQTYFSFTELLESDEGGQPNGDDASGTGLGNSNNQLSVLLKDGDNCATNTSGDCFEPTVSLGPTNDALQCKKCSHVDPVPDLSCEICGYLMHSHCSSWVEPPPLEGGWRCGYCREWR